LFFFFFGLVVVGGDRGGFFFFFFFFFFPCFCVGVETTILSFRTYSSLGRGEMEGISPPPFFPHPQAWNSSRTAKTPSFLLLGQDGPGGGRTSFFSPPLLQAEPVDFLFPFLETSVAAGPEREGCGPDKVPLLPFFPILPLFFPPAGITLAARRRRMGHPFFFDSVTGKEGLKLMGPLLSPFLPSLSLANGRNSITLSAFFPFPRKGTMEVRGHLFPIPLFFFLQVTGNRKSGYTLFF